MEIREVFARNLRKERQAKGLSQEELAHRAGIDRTYISSLERSVYAAGIDVVDRLATAMGIEASDLLKRTGRRMTGKKAGRPAQAVRESKPKPARVQE